MLKNAMEARINVSTSSSTLFITFILLFLHAGCTDMPIVEFVTTIPGNHWEMPTSLQYMFQEVLSLSFIVR